MDTHHRKIDLQSSADFTYLLNNIRQAAQEKIDIAIPRSAAPEGEDAYRTRVEDLVQNYIAQTLGLALPNLTVNGFDAPPSLITQANRKSNHSSNTEIPTAGLSDAEIAAGNYETYDPRLAEKLRSLYMQLEQESEKMVRMRREVPVAAAQKYREALSADMHKEQDDSTTAAVQALEQETQGQTSSIMDMVNLHNKDEAEQSWRNGINGLTELSSITSDIGKLERACKAVEVIENM